jgi:hypothetical protein
MKRYIFDIESLKNLFTATFVNPEDEKDVHVFYFGLGKEDYSDILKFLNQEMILVGYNCDSYDCPMLRFLMTYHGDKALLELNHLSGKLIDENFRNDKKIIELRYPRNAIYPWKSIDLMRILAFDRLGISLKQTAINLKWHKIQDMPIGHADKVKDDQLELILSYNLNDVLITKRLYEEIAPIRELRDELSKLYNVDLSSASDSRMANLILANIYSNELRMDIKSIRDMRTYRDNVLLKDCIAKFVKFKTPELEAMLNRISATIVSRYNGYKYSEKIIFANCIFNLGIGGLHTEDAPGIFVTDDKYIIQDLDVASYYPNLIINNNFYPEHLGYDFIKVLKKITAERISAKKTKNKVKADGLKITINSIFGKMGSEHFWLLDAKQMLSTTLSGQMGLLMLVEDLYLNGIQVISTNTDGIVCKIPRELESKYYEVAKNWEKATNLELEYTEYKKYIRRDVNSYITEKADKTTKEKGAFLKEVDLKKAYHMPIVAKALYAYFIKDIPVKQTLENCKDIMEFCISQKSGNKFVMELHGSDKIEKLQKTNRFYVSRKGGFLMKRDPVSNKLISVRAGRTVGILNDYDPNIPFKDYDVDLRFYETEVMKIVDEILPKQDALFDLSSLDKSTMLMQKAPATRTILNEERTTTNGLNKLGKNQLIKKIESIVENRQSIANISPRYVYIMDFDSKIMSATIYCLAKGIVQSVYIDKVAYNKVKIEKGQLVFCNKFAKIDGGHSVTEYKITDKIEEEKERLI